MTDDRGGYLQAFGVPVRIGGLELVGIYDENSEPTEFDGFSLRTTARVLLLSTRDADLVELAQGAAVEVWDADSSAWESFTARQPQPRLDGFTEIPLSA